MKSIQERKEMLPKFLEKKEWNDRPISSTDLTISIHEHRYVTLERASLKVYSQHFPHLLSSESVRICKDDRS